MIDLKQALQALAGSNPAGAIQDDKDGQERRFLCFDLRLTAEDGGPGVAAAELPDTDDDGAELPDPADDRNQDDEGDDYYDEDSDHGDDQASTLVCVGQVRSLQEALDLLANDLASLVGPEYMESIAQGASETGASESEYEQWLAPDDQVHADTLRAIASPARRLLAYRMLGYVSGPFDMVEKEPWEDPYVGSLPCRYPGARLVLIASAAPPNQEQAFCILELQPTGTPSAAEQALAGAAAAGDVDGIKRALAAGAEVNALDNHGMSALHAAVAHHRLAATEALLAAGADARLQADFGNAPMFAAVDHNQQNGMIGPYARRLHGHDHLQVLRALVAAGGSAEDRNRNGDTLLDIALATDPYPADALSWLAAEQAPSRILADQTLHGLLSELPYGSMTALRQRIHEVRFLLECGADAGEPQSADSDEPGRTPLHALVNPIGYYEHEVPPAVLIELIDLLVAHGARDVPSGDGQTARELAQEWVEHGLDHYALVVSRLQAVPG